MNCNDQGRHSSPKACPACCHPERSEGSLYEVPTSSPWMCTNIVATGSNGCSPWKQHHGSLADLRCQETGGVTRLVTHTETLRFAQGDNVMWAQMGIRLKDIETGPSPSLRSGLRLMRSG